jgi:hypothetical protein
MASGQKLNWFKSLRGADLTNGEFRIIVLLANYSGADMEDAHPGAERLAKDACMSERQVWRILDS